MPTCHHNFHLACIDVWLQKHSTCPICRLPLHDTFEASPVFGVLQETDDTGLPRDLSNPWLLPSHRESERLENNHEIHDSVSIDFGLSHELEGGS